MNLYFLESIGKLISLALLSIMPIFNPSVASQEVTMSNLNYDKNTSVSTIVVAYDTIKEYNDSLELGVTSVKTEGQNGLVYVGADGNEVTLVAKVDEVIEVGTNFGADYIGKMTGYGPDCVGCSAVGNVACPTKQHRSYSLINDGIYYDDSTYGKVRILAASLNKFPCGTIVYVDNGDLDPFYGIVLDTGIAMRNAWNNDQVVWMDLAFNSEKEALTGGATSSYVLYKVVRWGW